MRAGRRPGWSSQISEVVDRLFVYGTFRAGQSARTIVEAFVTGTEPATTRGALVDVPGEGYPGLVEDPTGTVVGEIVVLRDLVAALALLDAYEGDDYARALRTVRRGDGSEAWAWCYVLRDPARAGLGTPIPGGDWVRWRKARGEGSS